MTNFQESYRVFLMYSERIFQNIFKKAKISDQCEAGYTCYTKECKSKDGPEELKRNLKGLENAPKTPQSIAADGYFKQKLEEMECSNINLDDDIGLDQERYCCPNEDTSAASFTPSSSTTTTTTTSTYASETTTSSTTTIATTITAQVSPLSKCRTIRTPVRVRKRTILGYSKTLHASFKEQL